MGTVIVLGEEVVVSGYALAGALVRAANDEKQVSSAWATMPPDVEFVILTAAAARALGGARSAPEAPMTVVIGR
jgi:vacuolar-type H+-ATPase subunit F/Vma7